MAQEIKHKKGGKATEYKVLKKVYNANWRDDVPEQAAAEQLEYEFYKNEKTYVSPYKVSDEARVRLMRRAEQRGVANRLVIGADLAVR